MAAELLRERVTNPAVEIVSEQQLLPELMPGIAKAKLMIFIDASVSGRAVSGPLSATSLRQVRHSARPPRRASIRKTPP